MDRALWISSTAMEAQQKLTDTIANNMANVNTTGYKTSNVNFQDLLYQTVETPGAETSDGAKPVGIEMGTGVKVGAVSKQFTQGSLKNASSDLSMAIEGEGFFEVQLPDGTSAYTRNGSFHLNNNGQVVTSDGHRVVGFPNIDTQATNIDISADGTVSTTVDGESTSQGRISLVRFANPEGLKSEGHGLYTESEASGAPTQGNPGESGYGGISQHFLESSNVEIVKEMVDMISAQRAYELNSKSIKAADRMLKVVSQLA